MTRFWRLLFFTFGLSVFLLTLIRTIQPGETSGLYQVIYGDTFPFECCSAFMINEDKREAARVRLGTVEQVVEVTQVSPSREWRFANVNTPQGNRSYLIPLDGSEPMRLPESVNYVADAFWSTEEDILYLLQARFAQNPAFPTALFRLTPEDTEPVRLTRYQFHGIRSINEQSLPITTFTPWILLFYAINMLVIAGGLRTSRKK